MAKKQRPAQGEDAQAQVVQNRDTLQRLNFLLQASTYLANASSSSSSGSAPVPASHPAQSEHRHASRSRRTLSLHDLSRAYAHDIRAVGARTVTRMSVRAFALTLFSLKSPGISDPAVKRAICKGCSTVLVPGSTSIVRILPSRSHRHIVRTKCKACGATRAIPCPPREGEEEEKETNTAAAPHEKDGSEARQAKRRGARGKIPFHERPDHIVFRGRERLTHPQPEAEADDAEPPLGSH